MRGFLNRHRRKFIFGGIFIGSVIFLTRYTHRKLREWQEKEIKEMLEKTKRRQHFECTERTCNQMILSIALTLRESIIKILDITTIVNNLRSGNTPKVVSWNELKVLAIARSAVIVYSYAMLATLIRIQLNLVAGLVNKDGQNSGSSSTDKVAYTYMSLSDYFINEGITKLSLLIKDKVAEITASISLKDELTLRDLEQIYWAITSSISADNSKDPIKNLAEFMIRPHSEGDDEILSKMSTVTLDLLESEEVQNTTQSNIRKGFILLVDHIAEYFTGPPKANGTTNMNGISVPGTSHQTTMNWLDKTKPDTNYRFDDTFVDITKVSMPMAKIIPIVCGQVPDKSTAKDVPTDLLQQLILNSELQTLGANVFEAFSF